MRYYTRVIGDQVIAITTQFCLADEPRGFVEELDDLVARERAPDRKLGISHPTF